MYLVPRWLVYSSPFSELNHLSLPVNSLPWWKLTCCYNDGQHGQRDLEVLCSFCVRFSKHHNKPRAELGIGGRGIEVCCQPTYEIIKKLCESSAHRHEESDFLMLRRGCYMATQNVRIPAGLLPRLTYDKLQLSCPELPSWCVTQAHLASAVGCDISPPVRKILLLFLKTPPGALSLCRLNLLHKMDSETAEQTKKG